MLNSQEGVVIDKEKHKLTVQLPDGRVWEQCFVTSAEVDNILNIEEGDIVQVKVYSNLKDLGKKDLTIKGIDLSAA